MIRRPPRSTLDRSSAASDVYKRQVKGFAQDPRWVFLADDSRLSDPSVDPRVIMGHSQVTDLHLLNLAVRHNMRLATFDGKLLSGVAPADRHRMVLIPS